LADLTAIAVGVGVVADGEMVTMGTAIMAAAMVTPIMGTGIMVEVMGTPIMMEAIVTPIIVEVMFTPIMGTAIMVETMVTPTMATPIMGEVMVTPIMGTITGTITMGTTITGIIILGTITGIIITGTTEVDAGQLHTTADAITAAQITGLCFPSNAVCPRLCALAYKLGNFLRALATPEPINDWSMTKLREKLIKIGAKGVAHARCIAFRVAEIAVPTRLCAPRSCS
jgi:hypothetical protein